MSTKITQAGPWNMTVYTFEPDDSDNPMGRLAQSDVEVFPFGAVELSADGMILSHSDTEPDSASASRQPLVGRGFFNEVASWAGASVIAEEFRKGVAEGGLNVIFDCGVPRIPYKVRIHLKVSPILGTYWAFIKRLRRNAA